MTLLILKFTALGYNFQAIVSAPTPFLLFLVRLKRWRVDQGENAGQIGAAQQVRNTYVPAYHRLLALVVSKTVCTRARSWVCTDICIENIDD